MASFPHFANSWTQPSRLGNQFAMALAFYALRAGQDDGAFRI